LRRAKFGDPAPRTVGAVNAVAAPRMPWCYRLAPTMNMETT
jgi:hypothetical protein